MSGTPPCDEKLFLNTLFLESKKKKKILKEKEGSSVTNVPTLSLSILLEMSSERVVRIHITNYVDNKESYTIWLLIRTLTSQY